METARTTSAARTTTLLPAIFEQNETNRLKSLPEIWSNSERREMMERPRVLHSDRTTLFASAEP